MTGASGLIGGALRARLHADGHRVRRLVRTEPAGPDEVGWDPAAGHVDAAGLEGVDTVVHLSGRNVGASLRWTERHKQAVYTSRIGTTRVLSETLARLDPRPKVLVCASAVGYYGNRDDEVCVETTGPGRGFLAELVVDWEAASVAAEEAGIRVVHIRSGLVLTREGGLLPTMMLPFRFGLGGRLGSGEQWMSWIAIDDEVGAIVHLLGAEVSGPANLTSPEPVTNAAFTKTLARVLKRPAFLPVPAVTLKLALGAETAHETVLTSQRALPARLEASGYTFVHRGLEEALRAILGRPGS